mgnify:CR=1 FL=1
MQLGLVITDESYLVHANRLLDAAVARGWDPQCFLTDTGVYHYRESAERRYSRSTEAHNTIEIDGAEQSEVWKSFRVGRRAG